MYLAKALNFSNSGSNLSTSTIPHNTTNIVSITNGISFRGGIPLYALGSYSVNSGIANTRTRNNRGN